MDSYSTLLGASLFTLLLLLAIVIVTLVGKWKVYAKLGMPGWYSLIPVFSDYKLCERVRGDEENKTFLMAYLIVLICSWVLCWAPAVNWILIIAMGNMNGSIIAAALLTILPEALRSFSDYRMLVYGVVLVAMMLLKITDWAAIKRSLKTALNFKTGGKESGT